MKELFNVFDWNVILTLIVSVVTAVTTFKTYFTKRQWEYKVQSYSELLSAFARVAAHSNRPGTEEHLEAQRTFFMKMSLVMLFAGKEVMAALHSFTYALDHGGNPNDIAEKLLKAIRKELGAEKVESAPSFLFAVGGRSKSSQAPQQPQH